ncbi:MAG: hypothetical protein ACNA8H_10445, partial [Anaerolineales bacterium]
QGSNFLANNPVSTWLLKSSKSNLNTYQVALANKDFSLIGLIGQGKVKREWMKSCNPLIVSW